ncbi:MAG TPA: CopG family transcriptional regulator [Micromonosporaceae bacterium]|nr:CopG family transcriptional regulator [Micromonosporaceae bacterium]
MARTNIIDEDGRVTGWFDPDLAEEYAESTYWDGHNRRSTQTGSQWDHEILYHTSGGRWVLYTYSNRQGVPDGYAFVTPDRAREWLIKNEDDKAVERHFGTIEEERGPGRPEIGPEVKTRLPEEVVAALDAMAERAGLSRAAQLRQIVTDGVRQAGAQQ